MKMMKITGSDCYLQNLTNHVQRSPWLCCSNAHGLTLSSDSFSFFLSELLIFIRLLLAMVLGFIRGLVGRDLSPREKTSCNATVLIT